MGKRGKRGKKKFHCPECSVPFETKRSLNNHRKVHVPKVEAKLPPTKPSNNEQNRFRKESAKDADHLSKLPLWGTQGRDTINLGPQYVDSLSSSKSFKDFAAAGTKHFKEFKVQLDLVKSWGLEDVYVDEAMATDTSSKMKASLCKAVANFRVALAGATDPQSLIYKKEEEKASEMPIKRIVARNLFVTLSYLLPRVVHSARLALYKELAAVLATALSLGGGDEKWSKGVEEKWVQVVEMLKDELPELVNNGSLPISFVGEKVHK